MGDRGARAITSTLLALALIRAVLVFVPSMWAWGLNVQRFGAPVPGWLLWLAMALPLIPAVGEAVNARLEGRGDGRPGRSWASGLPAIAAAALCWILADRTWFTGDFLLRVGAAQTRGASGVFIQALPLERFLEQFLPLSLGTALRLDPTLVTRAIEALAAAALAVLASRLARAWGLAGNAARVAAATLFFGGYLTCFTGLGKPAALMCVLTAGALLGATELVQSGGGGMRFGLFVALAFLLHRSGLALVPLWLGALRLARRAGRPSPERPRLPTAIAFVLPALALALVAPSLWGILGGYDLPRHLEPGGSGLAGALALALHPLHLIDLANLLLFFTPAMVMAAVLREPLAPRASAGGERFLPALLAVSFVPLVLFVHPIQGVIRDLEVFAPAGLACAALSGRRLGEALASRRVPARLAPALLAAVVAPALQWLVHFHDPARGLERARAVALEAPARPEAERAQVWDALAYRAFRDRRWDRALEACEHAVRLAPHPRVVTMLAIARTYTGDYAGAESLYRDLATAHPEDPVVWLGLAGVSRRLGDSLWSARAQARLDAYPPEGPEALAIRRHLAAFPDVWPSRAPPARP